MIGLDSYSRQVFNYLDPILIYISLWIDCLFEIRKIAVCFLWLSLPGHYRVTDEALLAETTYYDPFPFLWLFSLLLKELILWFLFVSHPGKPQVKSYNTIFSLFTVLIRYQDEVYAYSAIILVSCCIKLA